MSDRATSTNTASHRRARAARRTPPRQRRYTGTPTGSVRGGFPSRIEEAHRHTGNPRRDARGPASRLTDSTHLAAKRLTIQEYRTNNRTYLTSTTTKRSLATQNRDAFAPLGLTLSLHGDTDTRRFLQTKNTPRVTH